MITNSKEQRICDKYSQPDETGKIRCYDCPLRKGTGNYDFRCKANSHYDKRLKEWVTDND